MKSLISLMLIFFSINVFAAKVPESCDKAKFEEMENTYQRPSLFGGRSGPTSYRGCLLDHVDYYSRESSFDFSKIEDALFALLDEDRLTNRDIKNTLHNIKVALRKLKETRPDTVLNISTQLKDVLFGLCGECLDVYSPQTLIDIERYAEEAKLYKARNERWQITDKLVDEFKANQKLLSDASDPELIKALAYAQHDLYAKVKAKTPDRAEEKIKQETIFAIRQGLSIYEKKAACAEFSQYQNLGKLMADVIGRYEPYYSQNHFCK